MADDAADPFPKLGSVYRGSGSKFNQKGPLNYKHTSGSIGGGYSSQAWGNPSVIHKPTTKWGNGGSSVGQGNNNNHLGKSNGKCVPHTLTSPTPWKGLHSSVVQRKNEGIIEPFRENNDDDEYDDESDDDIVYDSDDDLSLYDTDSESGEKKLDHEGCKKSKWFRKFFNYLDKLPDEEISSEARRWHCPACHGGVGAIDWYYGLQPLLIHARTIKVRKAKLHRMFADTLENECLVRKAPLTNLGDAYGLWEGLDKNIKDHEIVWPPMVVIMNTRFQRDENNKWIGMGNQELLDCFSDYAALKARHAYGPQGHRGMGVLIFDTTTAGYLESVRLHKHFKEQGRDREAWDHCKNPFVPGGKRQLYGYLATREDLDIFNQHCGGKSRLKFEMRSYQEMVESKIKNINQDSQLLEYFKNVAAKEKLQSEAFADSLSKVSEKLRKATAENRVVRQRTKEQNQQNKEEMDAQEQFFLDQIQVIHRAIDAKEQNFEKLQKNKREVKLAGEDSSEKEDINDIMDNISGFIMSQDKDMRQFEAERDHIMKIHEEKQLVLKKKQWQEQIELEMELEKELTQLMSKYTLSQSQEDNYKK